MTWTQHTLLISPVHSIFPPHPRPLLYTFWRPMVEFHTDTWAEIVIKFHVLLYPEATDHSIFWCWPIHLLFQASLTLRHTHTPPEKVNLQQAFLNVQQTIQHVQIRSTQEACQILLLCQGSLFDLDSRLLTLAHVLWFRNESRLMTSLLSDPIWKVSWWHVHEEKKQQHPKKWLTCLNKYG